MAELNITAGVNAQPFVKGIREMQTEIANFSAEAEKGEKSVESLQSKLAGMAGGIGLSLGLGELAKKIVETRGEFEALEQSFKTLLRSEEDASRLMNQLVKTSATTPFDLKGVADSAKSLLAYGMAADEVNDKIVQLGNIASGLGLNLNDTIMLYGTTVSKDAADSLDIKQFQSRGIAIKKAIADVLEIEENAVDDAVTKKLVTGDVMSKAIENLTTGSGQFAGMMEEQSRTILGQISNIEDAFDMMLNNIGQSNEGLIKDALSGVGYLIENYEEVGKSLAILVGTYGLYKAALMVNSATAEVTAKAEKAALQSVMDTMDGKVSVSNKEAEAILGVKLSTDKEVAALQKELAIRVKKAQQQAKDLTQTAAETAAVETRANAELQLVNAQVKEAQAKLQTAVASGNAEAIATAQTKLNTLAQKQNELALQANVAALRNKQAQEAATAATTKATTMQTQMQTVAQNAHTAATSKMVKAQGLLKKALQATGLSALANPYVLAAAAIAAAAFAVYKFVTAETESEKAIKKVAEAFDESQKGAVKETANLQALTEQLQSAKKGTEEYELARQQLVQNFGQYHQNLEAEIDSLTTQSALYDELIGKIQKKYLAQAKTQATETAYADYQNMEDASSQAMQKAIKKAREEQIEYLKDKGGADASTENLAEVTNMYNKMFRELNKQLRDGAVIDWNAIFESSGLDRTNIFVRDIYSDIQDAFNDTREALIARNDALKDINERFADEEKDNNGGGSGSTVVKRLEAEYANVDEVVKKIKEAQAELTKARENFNKVGEDGKKLTHKNTLGQDVEWSVKDIEGAEASLKKLKSDYKTITGKDYDKKDGKQKKEKDNLDEALEAQRKLAETQSKQAQMQARQREISEAQARADAMRDGYAKVMAQRDVNHAKGLLQIAQNAESERQSAINQAKATFDAEQKVREEQAKKAGKTYKRKTWKEDEWTASEQGKKALGEIAQREEDATNRETYNYARTANADQQKALEAEQKFWADYLAIITEGKKSEEEIRQKEAEGVYTADQAEKLVALSQQQTADSLAASGYDESRMEQEFDNINDLADAIVKDKMADLFTQLELVEARLEQAKGENDQADIAKYKAQIAALKKQIASSKDNLGPDKKAIKQWKDYATAVSKATGQLRELGSELGGEAEQWINMVADVIDTTMSGIDNIVSLTNTSVEGMQGTAEAGARAMQAVERASVILAIIGAALQIMQKLDGLFSGMSESAQYEKAAEKQKQINTLAKSVRDYEAAVLSAQLAEKSWFSQTGLDKLTDSFTEGKKALENYYAKANEQQEKYIDKAAGRTGLGAATVDATKALFKQTIDVMKGDLKELAKDTADVMSAGWTGKAWDEYNGQKVSAVDNLRIETKARQHGTWFRKGSAQETADLRTWAKEQYGDDLFGSDGMVNVDMAKNIIDTYGDKLQGETKATLEQLIEYKEQWDEAMNQLKDYVSEMYAPVVDNMTEAIWNWLETGEDVMDSFNDYASDTFKNVANEMLKSMTQKLVFGDYEEQMKDAYEQYAKGDIDMTQLAQKSASLTKGVQANLQAHQKELTDFAEMLQSNYDSIGIDITGNKEDEQKATYGGYETMSEQTGTELSGRFSAMYVVQSQTLTCVSAIAENLATQLSLVSAVGGNLQSLITIQGQSLMALNGQTAMQKTAFAEMNDALTSIKKSVKTLE